MADKPIAAEIDLEEYVTCPLTPEEIQALEAEAGTRIPSGFRDFLRRVGIPQNLVASIVQDERSLIKCQVDWEPDGFVFASPGEGPLVETPGGQILEIDYGESRVVYDSFREFLADNIAPPEDPRELCWAVQLSFKPIREEHLVQSLREQLGHKFDSNWVEVDISPAGVTSYRNSCSECSDSHLKRMEYSGWNRPLYFLNQAVPPAEIRDFKDHLAEWNSGDLGFTLVNYGILPKDLSGE